MGYSPRYRIWSSENPQSVSETDSLEAIKREKSRCQERGDYFGYVLDTKIPDVEKFGVWPTSQGQDTEQDGK